MMIAKKNIVVSGRSVLSGLALASCLALGANANAQFVVDTDLGTLGLGTYSLSGDTTGAGDEAQNYPDLTNTAFIWVEDVVFQFTTTEETTYQLINNGTILGDPDFFLLDSLSVTAGLADGALAADFLDGGADGGETILSAGTYYVSVDAFGGDTGDSSANVGAFDVTLSLTSAPIVSDLGTLALDGGEYDRAAGGAADHPYGELVAFTVDADGAYDILGEWLDATGAPFDGYLYLFDEAFAEDDSVNIAFDDDFGTTDFSLIEDVFLTAGTEYYLVGTTFGANAGVTGLTGEITVTGPGNASLVPEPSVAILSVLGALSLASSRRRR